MGQAKLPNSLRICYPAKAHVYTARDLGVSGREDPKVIDKAIAKRCLIVTVNKDFLNYYRNHVRRRGRNGMYFYGLIFLKASQAMTKKEQLMRALKAMAWDESRDHDDLIMVSAQGKTKHERLCHPECAAEFPADQTVWT